MEKNIMLEAESDVDNEQEILTLKNLFFFLKKSALRVLIYCLLMLLVSTAIFMTLNLIKNNKKIGVASAQIQFNYAGIEKGLDPYGQKFDVEFVKSPYVINRALNNLGLDYDVNSVRNNLHVNAVIPIEVAEQIYYNNLLREGELENWDKIKDVSYYPTDYIIELSDFALNEAVAKELLAEIIKEAKEVFMSNYNNLLIYNFTFLNETTMQKYDFFDQSEIFETQLYQLENYFNYTLYNHVNFKSATTSQTIKELSIKTNLLRLYDLSQISKFISADNVTKVTYGDFAKLLKEQERKYQSEINVLSDKETVLQNAITLYGKEETVIVTSSDGTLTTINRPSEYYESLFRDLVSVQNDIAYYNEKLSLVSDQYIKVSQLPPEQTSSSEDISRLNNMFDQLIDDYNALIGEANITISEFLESDYNADILKTTIAPIYSVKIENLEVNIIYMIFLSVLIGMFIAFVETGIRIYLKHKKQNKATI